MPSAMTKVDVKNKIDLGARIASYPMPVVLVGANVNGKPNFLPIGWFMNAGFKPPKVAVVLNKVHYTNQGTKEKKHSVYAFPQRI